MSRCLILQHFSFCNYPAGRVQRRKLCVIQLYALQWRRGGKGPAESNASDGRNVADTRRTGDSCADS